MPRRAWRSRFYDEGRGVRIFVLALVAIWGFAHWQLLRAAMWGVVLVIDPSRRRGSWFRSVKRATGDRELALEPLEFWFGVAFWTGVGPAFLAGTAVFLWLQRHDRF